MLSKKVNELKQELTELMKKEKKSKVYHRKRQESSSTSSAVTSDEGPSQHTIARERSVALSEQQSVESGEHSDSNDTVLLSDSFAEVESPGIPLTQAPNPDF